MARVHRSVFAARAGKTRLPVTKTPDGQPALQCGAAGPAHYITKGQPYLWYAPGFRSLPRVRCTAHPPKASELDTSLFSEITAAQEAASVALGHLDLTQDADAIVADVQAVVEDVRAAVESVADQYSDADEAMGGHGGQFADWATTLGDQEVMSWEASSYDSFEPDSNACDAHDTAQDTCDDCTASVDDAREQWALGLVEAAQEVIDDVSKE